MTVTLRPLADDDLVAAQSLLAELGYEIDPDTLADRLAAVLNDDQHVAFVAVDAGGHVFGLVHAYVRSALEKPVEVYVQSLVVSAAARKMGVGRALMQEVETWAKDRQLETISLHTQVHRDDARAFYTREGYDEITQARLMRKSLNPKTA